MYPTARGMCAEGTPFRGVLFAGLMIKEGQVRHHCQSNPEVKATWLLQCLPTLPALAVGAVQWRCIRRPPCSAALSLLPPPPPPPPPPTNPPCQAKLLEHNVRFGDPECQSLMVRLQSDLLESMLAQCRGEQVRGWS